MFRRMDDDGNKQLSLEEFRTGLADTGMECDSDEVQEMFDAYVLGWQMIRLITKRVLIINYI